MDMTTIVILVLALLVAACIAVMAVCLGERGKAQDKLIDLMCRQIMAHSQGELDRLKIERDKEYMHLAQASIVNRSGAYVPESVLGVQSAPKPNKQFDMETDSILGG